MDSATYLRGLVVAMLCLVACVTPAAAAELPPYEFDPTLSLTGDCSIQAPDNVPDPGCPGGSHPPSGRFSEPRSVAIDGYGNEYVASYAGDPTKGRIDVFDDEGKFITELPDPNGPKSLGVDSKGNLYAYEGQEIVRYAPSTYDPGAGNIAYSGARVVVDPASGIFGGIAIDIANDHLYVAQGTSIGEYGSAAEGNKLLNTISHPKLSWTTWVAVDSKRDRLYASFCEDEILDCGVLVFEASAPYALLGEVDGSNTPGGKFVSTKGWLSIAVDEKTGDFFVDDLEYSKSIYQFDENYEFVSKLTFPSFQGGNALQMAISNSSLDPNATNKGYLFVPVVLPAGRVFAFAPPDELPPDVLQVQATNIGETEAELQATIDPRGGDTSYRLEYVSQKDFELDGFARAIDAGQGVIPGSGQEQRVSAILGNLSPGTAYRFRVLAESKAGKAEPISEGSFFTYFDAPVNLEGGSCTNDPLRVGASALLPDCRAYELVTPPDTNSLPPRGGGVAGDRFGMVQASPDGNVVSFELIGGVLPGVEGTGGFHGDPYRAGRGGLGWAANLAGPSGVESSKPQPGSFSPDQGHSFWIAGGIGGGTAVVDGRDTGYVRYPDGHSELVGRGSLGTDPGARGKFITENGSHIIFQTENVSSTLAVQLEPVAPSMGTGAVYDRTADEVTHVVSLLPDNVTPAAGEDAFYLGASPDGRGIAFEIGNVSGEEQSEALYLRKDNTKTYEIGKDITFAGVSENGDRLFYVEGGDLYAFDTATEEAIAFSSIGNAIPVNVALDGTRAYFVTTSVIPGGGQNPNGAFAKAGQHNLYLSEEGDISFVATVTARDVEGEVTPGGIQMDGLGLWTRALISRQPGTAPSRLTPDGSVLLFQSRANLDEYDPSGAPQIYRYDAIADRLHCISCIPTRTTAGGGARLQSFANVDRIAPLSRYDYVPNVRSDGRRVFFESEEALVSTDTNEAQDVYEWEAQGVGSCARTAGCVYLISSGRSKRGDYLFGHSASGDDVFFVTGDVLTGFDTGATPSIYDARVGGGFPEDPRDNCAGEACRPGLTPPSPFPTPESGARSQSGNVVTPKPKKCLKGKRKIRRNGKVRCVKKHSRKGSHRRAGARGGRGR